MTKHALLTLLLTTTSLQAAQLSRLEPSVCYTSRSSGCRISSEEASIERPTPYSPSHSHRYTSPSASVGRSTEIDDLEEEEKPMDTINLTLPSDLRSMRFFASPYEYAVLSDHVYRDDVEDHDTVEVKTKRGTHTLKEWICLLYTSPSPRDA